MKETIAAKLTKEIIEKYPKTFTMIKKYIESVKLNSYEMAEIEFNEGVFDIIYTGDYGKYYICEIPFSIFYQSLEKFFFQNNIKLIKILLVLMNEDDLFNNKVGYSFDHYQQLQQQVILKTCEILENK